MAEVQPIIVFRGRHFVRHLGICNRICVKLLQIMSGVIQRNLKNDVSISNRFPEVHKRGIHIHTQTRRHTDTHDDIIRQNAMRCISPKNAPKFQLRNMHFQQQQIFLIFVKILLLNFSFINLYFRDSTSDFRL